MFNKRYVFTALSLVASLTMLAQTWIWYPGDYEIWLGNKMNNRRTERGAFFPPFWKIDGHYPVVEFSKAVNLSEPETLKISAEGKFNLKIDGKLQFGMPDSIVIPAGQHQLNIKVWNQATPPAIFVDGATIKSGADWNVTFEDKEWIDESGKVSDTSTTVYCSAGSWNFNDPTTLPSQFALPTRERPAVETAEVADGTVYDFGRESFGYLMLKGVEGLGRVNIYYGESREEAIDTEFCETLDAIEVTENGAIDLSTNALINPIDNALTLDNSKALRYVYIAADPGVSVAEVALAEEFAPVEHRGSFRCNDKQINDIWDIGAYTMDLTTREFFIDGIKRDRWVWSGDAVQSYLMNYYLGFDNETVKRTTWLLRGKDPVTSHINTILDYTFYWFIGVYDYYLYTGDADFVRQLYPRMTSMMNYVRSRLNPNGMAEGLAGDWVFVDWADGYLDKNGELSFEQILLCRSLETMALCAAIADDPDAAAEYAAQAARLRAEIFPAFWNNDRGALVHNRLNGAKSDSVTRYSNIFAVLFGYTDDDASGSILNNVLLNDNILKITTPYMRFYELEALCRLGRHDEVLGEIRNYWGGMVDQGATTFWEKYDPTQSGAEHLAMYNRPYGKSLCHAWGASPVYLLGKYFLGVQPIKPGYAEYEISPNLAGLKWMEGTVPTPNGDIALRVEQHKIEVSTPATGVGSLYVESTSRPKATAAGKSLAKNAIENLGGNSYRIVLPANSTVTICY